MCLTSNVLGGVLGGVSGCVVNVQERVSVLVSVYVCARQCVCVSVCMCECVCVCVAMKVARKLEVIGAIGDEKGRIKLIFWFVFDHRRYGFPRCSSKTFKKTRRSSIWVYLR